MADDLLKQFEPHEQSAFEYERQLWEARFTPSGRFLVAGGYDATVQRWRVGDDKCEPLPALNGHNGWVQCVQTLTGDRAISADSWGRVTCWNSGEAPDQAQRWTCENALGGWIRAIAVSPDESLVAVAGNDSAIRLFNVADGSPQSELASGDDAVFSLAFTPDGKRLASGNLKGVIQDWNLATGKADRTLDASALYKLNHMQEAGGVRRLVFNEEATQLICGGQKDPGGGFAKGAPAILVFDWKTGKQVHELVAGDTQEGFIYDTQLHPAGFVMGCASAFPGKGKLFFWKPGPDKPFFTGTKLTNGRSVSLHPDGKRIAYLTSNSPNANGRPLKDGAYVGGSAVIRIMKLGAEEKKTDAAG